MISSKILADSINASNRKRLTTFLLRYPRIVHAEHLRHRIFSFSVSSSRAIPIKKMVDDVLREGYVPTKWRKNQKGMSPEFEINEEESVRAWSNWISARSAAMYYAQELDKLGVAKEITNRLLEPFMYVNVLCSGTDFENFFALRANKFAQHEIQELAYLMLEEYNKSQPREIAPLGAWLVNEPGKLSKYLEDVNNYHVPFGDKMPEDTTAKEKLMISCARAARLSYSTFDGEINKDKDIELFNKLVAGNHMSALEHVAYPVDNTRIHGNFTGWMQLRKTFENECLRDNRVIKK